MADERGRAALEEVNKEIAVKDESGAKQMQKITYFRLIAIICFWRAALTLAADPPSLRPLAPDYVRSLKSQNSNTQTTVNFINQTDDPVDVYWVNYEGNLVFYQHLAAGESWVVQTYVTHPWAIYDDNIPSHGVGFLPIETAAQAVIRKPDLKSSALSPNAAAAGNSSSGANDGKAAVNGSVAAAFDCSKANSPAEKRICSDPLLAKMDHEMGTLYRNLIRSSKNAKAWESDQRGWLVHRNRCKGDDSCLRSKYLERLVILRAGPPSDQWAAEWWRVDYTGFNGAGFAIAHATAHSFDFHIQASAGAHTGELEGKATIDSSNKAHWHSRDKDIPKCFLDFRRGLNRLEIGGRTDDTSCGAGMDVDFSGTYVAGGNDPNSTPDLVSLGVVQTPEQDDALRKLMGKDYDAMAGTANLQSTDDNLDGNDATVISMFVRGLACSDKSILMFDAKGHLWAAVWVPDPKSSDDVELHYYTNVPSDKNTLPKTIAGQREACGQTVRVRMMP